MGDIGRHQDDLAGRHPVRDACDGDIRRAIQDLNQRIVGRAVLAQRLIGIECKQGHAAGGAGYQGPADNCAFAIGDEACEGVNGGGGEFWGGQGFVWSGMVRWVRFGQVGMVRAGLS